MGYGENEVTEREASLVLNILATADHNCSFCASRLMAKFIKAFGFSAEAHYIFNQKFEEVDSLNEAIEGKN